MDHHISEARMPDSARCRPCGNGTSQEVLVSDELGTARKYVFLVGCPRSGTTWLQLLLWQHPEISSCMETHLFKYISPVVDTWEHYKGDRVGLQYVLSEEEFIDLLRSVALRVLHKIGDGAVIVEKTSEHVWWANLILRLIPQAWFIHIIRDPRAVTSSLISAGRSWGSHWASTSAAENATCWVDAVSAGRKIRRMTDRYLEVRYEDLLADGVTNLQRVFDWLELECEPGLCERAIETCTLDRLKARAVQAPWPLEVQPDGFYRKGNVEGWREELPGSTVQLIESIAGDLMRELGYAPATAAKELSL